ncbi:Dual specificity protein phosphatase 16 [Merluccius polli]|uniref:Dual specificity protein phosphatase 16 n=1 Tax=Merluccius polli TaxID=89951 RepID=A0AA47NCX0_MERPO|nr:Dual specificity protein phosphatase 16 [Merluccius polli]
MADINLTTTTSMLWSLQLEPQGDQEVVVYDLSSTDPGGLSSDGFLSVLLAKLERSFPSVHLLSGGFSQFSQLFPGLCEGKSTLVPSCMSSQPSLPVANLGPTRILPHLYLGCQRDVLNKDLMQQNDIAYVLNASNTCPKPDFISESHFLRVPVNDSFCEKILPWLDKSVEFIERAKACNARVLVHCLAGISRSATIAIAYIMKRMDMSLDEAYRFVKEKRPTISPNFNFLGQLLDFEKKIKSPRGTDAKLKSGQSEVSAEAAEAPGEPREAGGEACPGFEALAWLEPLTLPCVLAANGPEEQRLAQALSGLQLAEGPEDSARLKRSFSLDIKSYGELGGGGGGGVGGGGGGGSGGGSSAPHRIFAPQGDAPEYFKPSAFKEPASKPCQFSPVEEVSEQSTPEQSPDKEQADGPSSAAPPLHSVNGNTVSSTSAKEPGAKPAKLLRSSSREENNSAQAASFLLGLSHSQQHLARPGAGGCTLKGWHSDILLGPVTVSTSSLAGGWYLSSDPTRFYSTSAILSGGGGNVGNGGGSFAAYSCSQGLEAVRRRGRQKSGDRGDSRRSWHEESTFEKQLKRRSCQMEFGGGMLESRSREEMGKVGSQTSFSGSMEIIEVS